MLADRGMHIHFAGVTGSGAEGEGPEGEVPACFDRFESALWEDGICSSFSELDFLEIHAFGTAANGFSPIKDPEGSTHAKRRTRDAYRRADASYWAEKLPGNSLPTRFSVNLEDLPYPKVPLELSDTTVL